MSYLQDRLSAYHITDADNTFKAAAEDPGHFVDFRFFTETKDGDISINYLTPDGAVEYYEHGHVQTRRFSRIRKANPGDGPKYLQERGTETFPFCTPAVVNAYRRNEPLKVLYVVEGEFKAFSLSMQGLPALGIGGVQNFRDAKKTHLHPYITDIIERCKVRNVVLIYDADCVQVEWKEGKDLAERPNMFYSALNTFNELLKPYDVQLYALLLPRGRKMRTEGHRRRAAGQPRPHRRHHRRADRLHRRDAQPPMGDDLPGDGHFLVPHHAALRPRLG